MKTLLASALLFGAGLAACKSAPDSGATTAAPVASHERLGPTVMLRHETYAVGVRDGILRNDLERARRNATELRAVPLVGSPELNEHAKTMNDAARRVAEASDLPTAARATGTLVGTCAGCHARMTGPTRLDVRPEPEAEPRRGAQMRRHVWAMNALWDALIGNSEAPWRAGADVLADDGLTAAELSPKGKNGAIADAAATMHGLGRRAQGASDPGVRAEIYGELLVTCAACHATAK